MTTTIYRSIGERILLGRQKIENTLNSPEILTLVSRFGYDETALNNALVLSDECDTLVKKQQNEYSQQYVSTRFFEEEFHKANKQYINTLELARIAFKNDNKARINLQLDGRRKSLFLNWYTQAKAFYFNLLNNPDWVTTMGRFGYTTESITEEMNNVDMLFELHNAKTREKGEAQTATQERDNKVEVFEEWITDYTRVARIALQDSPQLLEKLGIVVPS